MAALELGRRASELTGGAFDVTVAPLVEAWGFGPAKRPPAVPAAETLAALRARVGYRQLSLDAARRTVTKARPDVACDVSALAGGWAADRVARALVALGHADVLVDVGGEVSARGRRPGRLPLAGRGRGAGAGRRWPRSSSWRTPPSPPPATTATPGPTPRGGGAATSSTPGRASRSPTGSPPSPSSTADGAWADALATGLLVLGPDAGRALAARERLAARLVLRQADGTYAEWSTPAFEALVAPAR